MARAKKTVIEPRIEPAPAMSTKARENQMIALAIDVAEEQLRNRTASSQVITHYLKLATAKEQLEIARLEQENELLKAKTEAIQSAKRSEELYEQAIKAMGIYGGHQNYDYEDDHDPNL